ncbi:glycosyltransferase [Marinilongibacter aquaticus]|uniref:glycosyltransferase family 2 protein n=1 Tax=Marinilongibacter aquaticus TaxID=2975157 RepID=UPI0021BDD385|nr:glycosyltransferase family 2 protein [Marinilongibacter aquaticus]UBM58903.1 glycosyltransferase [Marinilongibacter aquaticus]
MPFVSIIVVTYQAEKFVARTLESIERQIDKGFELVVIDGNSNDQTMPILRKYKYLIDILVSEPDKGIYDAMNKGIRLANGRFLWFINAGDEIADEHTLGNIHSACLAETDLIYGDALLVNSEGVARGTRSALTPHKLHENIDWRALKYGMLVCHQSLLVSKEIAPNYMLNNLSADLDWEINSFKRADSPLYLSFSLSKYLEGGISNQRLGRSLWDRFKVLHSHFGLWENLKSHGHILFRGLKLIASNRGKYW